MYTFPNITVSENPPVCVCVGGGGGGGMCVWRGRGEGLREDMLAHRLIVLKTPAPKGSRDSLCFRTFCVEKKDTPDNSRYFINWRSPNRLSSANIGREWLNSAKYSGPQN